MRQAWNSRRWQSGWEWNAGAMSLCASASAAVVAAALAAPVACVALRPSQAQGQHHRRKGSIKRADNCLGP